MKRLSHQQFIYRIRLATIVASATSLSLAVLSARADLAFLGVAAGDATATDAVLWTRAVDTNAPAETLVTALVSAKDTNVTTGELSFPVRTVAARDYTAKVIAANLLPGMRYYYRFINAANPANTSIVGTFKTAPNPGVAAPVRFGFSGDADGLMRPYALAHEFPSLGLDFFMWCGDTIYETASAGSPSVTLSGTIPAPSTNGATSAQLFGDYSKKYREQFLAVNPGGQKCLQPLFAAQGNYTLYDNHELGNRQYINGGAAPGGPVGDMPAGAGVDARIAANDVNTTGTFMNKSPGFQILRQVYLSYQPVRETAPLSTPGDPNTDGTPQLFLARNWGRHVLFVNTDDRSYRDIRMKTAANADDTGPRADNANRTMFGKTELAWLKQALLDAQNAGVAWKFVTTSDPIDQLGPIGGALTNTLTSVNGDGGKSYMGGYRPERNDLLKFIADHHILNVVFLATDDHQNRINELLYSTNGQTSVQATYVRIAHCFSIVDGPLGATGPETITNHSFANIKAIADSLASAQIAAGLEPVGLDPNYPGLFNVIRDGDPGADSLRQPIDFYSPDTFNVTTFDISEDGRILTVKSLGINSTPQNAQAEYDPVGNPMREILSFQIDGAPEPAFTNCPGDLVLNNDPGQCSATIDLPGATGRPEPVVTCTINGLPATSPYTFPKGRSVVLCTASNNLGVATCAFFVTVNDTEAPVAACRPGPNPSGKNVPGGKNSTANPDGFVELLSKDNCDPNPQIYVADSASPFIAGPFVNGEFVKITTDARAVPTQKKMGGVVSTHIILNGTALIYAADASGNTSTPQPGCSNR
jgi:phosphodiesterase/alkaline phosphatase D-like protein